MLIEPASPAFAARYAAGEPQVVWTTLVADLETPGSAFLKLAGARPQSFLLESVEGDDEGRPDENRVGNAERVGAGRR